MIIVTENQNVMITSIIIVMGAVEKNQKAIKSAVML